MGKGGVNLEVGGDGVALVTVSNSPVNALAPALIQGLKEKYIEVMSRDDVKAIVLTGNYGSFFGSFDINIFQRVHATGDVSLVPDVSVELLVNIIEDAKKPSVAAVQGLALGGGLELAMSCHARISTPGTQLGLPELTLGMIPGFGGTQRLPRLVGLTKAIELMLHSKSISAKQGKTLGLIDELASSSELIRVSRLWALDIANGHKPWISSLRRTDRLGSLSEACEIIKMARLQAKCTSPNMPQHNGLLDAVQEGVLFGGYAGVLKEAKISKEMLVSNTSKCLVHVFYAQRETSKVPNVSDIGLKPRQIRKVAVIGGGLMGSGIATALTSNNISVILKEIDFKSLQKGMKMITAHLDGLVKKGTLTQDKMRHSLSLLEGSLDYSDLKDVDMVIEAVIENIPVKQLIFRDIEKVCPPHCVLATNTIDLHVGDKTTSQDRIIGAHFFSPAHTMPLLEIVPTEKTSPQVILDVLTIGKDMKKVPVVVRNSTGLAVNRTFFPYTQGAQFLASLGVDVFRIDQVIRTFGMPMGPFQLADVAGYSVALAAKREFADSFKGRTFENNLVEMMLQRGRNGKNNGKGFYIYGKGMTLKPDPTVQPVVEEFRRNANTMPGGEPVTVSDQEILEVVFFPVVNEACHVLDEGVVIKAADLDIASVLGMGFPNYRGGLVFWADSVGAGYIYERLRMLEEKYGGFFKPSQYLEERARSGIPLGAATTQPSQRSRARM